MKGKVNFWKTIAASAVFSAVSGLAALLLALRGCSERNAEQNAEQKRTNYSTSGYSAYSQTQHQLVQPQPQLLQPAQPEKTVFSLETRLQDCLKYTPYHRFKLEGILNEMKAEDERKYEEQIAKAREQIKFIDEKVLAAYYFDDVESLTKGHVQDDSGHGNNGSMRGNVKAVKVDGERQDDYALEFDGQRGYVEIPNNLSLNLGLGTVSARIFPRGYGREGRGRVLEKGGEDKVQYALYFFDNGMKFDIRGGKAADGGRIYNSLVLGPVELNKWFFVKATFDGKKMGLSLNDSNLLGEFNGELTESGFPLTIGNRIRGDRPFDGMIDSVTISSVSEKVTGKSADENKAPSKTVPRVDEDEIF